MEEEYLKNIKGLYRDKSSIVICLLCINLVVSLMLFVYSFYFFKKINKKIDFRYFNITRTIEDIHKVKINTYNGSIVDYR